MIIYKSKEEIRGIRKSNRIVAKILAELKALIQPGVSTLELDEFAEKKAREMGSVPAFKNYKGYPASLCTSINEEIVHGIPSSSRKLKEGDIIGLDFGVIYDGYYGDAAVTYPVGNISPKAEKLIQTAKEAFYKGFEKVQIGNRISDISFAIQNHVESQGFSVIRAFVGHGIGFSLHEEPQVPNFGLPGRGPKIKAGLTIAIEPMIAEGGWDVEILHDKWTAVTRDRSLSAHHENTVVSTTQGPEILSKIGDEKSELPDAKEKYYA
ncbi:MAG: type I methionyl aminopeptidase [Candidatus Aminicenantes bacterium]|nr:type I methionyl aminopeptidase [Candidatus Aminicenantes bacterium]